MAERQLIVVVEATAAMGSYWQTILSDYLENIIRFFCSNELAGQKNSTSNVELSLIAFNTHGSHWAFLVQRSGWTKDVNLFLQWLSALPFSGGCFNDAAIAEGLFEALRCFLLLQMEIKPIKLLMDKDIAFLLLPVILILSLHQSIDHRL